MKYTYVYLYIVCECFFNRIFFLLMLLLLFVCVFRKLLFSLLVMFDFGSAFVFLKNKKKTNFCASFYIILVCITQQTCVCEMQKFKIRHTNNEMLQKHQILKKIFAVYVCRQNYTANK